ncbi:MAG: hypothetical protein EA353_14010 [Puniceicoccaceae bacterium]|nr:MAG: hypothetical protein EA353_14010 [Puniceicoccaceae bacterium]
MRRFTLFLFFILSVGINAKPVDLNELTLVEIASGSIAWPELEFTAEVDSDQPSQFEDVALSVLGKLQEHESSHGLAPEELVASGRLYAELAKVFSNSKGYYNLVLADACRRLALSRIGYGLVNSSDEVELLRETYGKLQSSLILEQEAAVLEALDSTIDASLSVESLTNPEGLSRTWEALGTSIAKVRYEAAKHPNSAKSVQLIQYPSAALLLNNLSETDLILSVHIPGMIAFIERGGQLDQIDLSNITKFKEIMGDTRSSFSFPPLSVKKLYAIHLYSLVEMFSSDEDFMTNDINDRVF